MVSKRDRAGDVRFTSEKGLSRRQRRTVDLRRLSVTKFAAGPEVRLRLRRVVTDGSFDQYFFVYFYVDGNLRAYFKIHGSRPTGTAGFEGADTPQHYTKCRVKGQVSENHKQLTVSVPARCVPSGPVEIETRAYTTPLGKEGGSIVFSNDRMRIRHPVIVRG